jgi:hypothetical protein
MQRFAFRLRNSRSASIHLRLEPWGELYELEPLATIDVQASGPDGDRLEVDSDDSSITIYGWPGSAIELYHKGVRLVGSGRIGER